jgi:hypothetical protein
MNVVSLDIEITKEQDRLDGSIKEVILSRYKANSAYSENYSNRVIQKWSTLKYKILKGFFDVDQMLASAITKGIEYFLIIPDLQNLQNQNDITLTVLLISKGKNISLSLNDVIASIQEILFNLTVKPISQNPVSLFPFDKTMDDIYEDIKINAELKHVRIAKGEIIGYMTVLVLSIILMAIQLISVNLTETQNAVLIGFYAAGYLFVLTELILKFLIPVYFQKHRYIIEIPDLSNPIDKNYKVPFGDSTEINNLQTPIING